METIKNILHFKAPGDPDKWEESCLPVGNGYMGASFFGGVSRERVVLNEKTLWTGGPSESRPDYNGGNRKGAYAHVRRTQELLRDGSYNEALNELPFLTCEGMGEGFGAYQLLCDAVFDFPGLDDFSGYSRSLDMDKSLYSCTFTCGGARYTREAFASYPDRVICLRFKCDKPNSVNFTLSLDKIREGGEVRAFEKYLEYGGALRDNGLRYCGIFDVRASGGEVVCGSDTVEVKNADEAVVLFSAATDYADEYPAYRSGIAPAKAVRDILDKCGDLSFDELYSRHYADHSTLFGRVKLSLNGACGEIPAADVLFDGYRKGDINAASQLETLYFQFGRYMLISSSREGSLPANLQGVWNESNNPPWNCDYHINVNLQMNYWGAYSTNLAETAKPLIRYLDKMRAPGRVTACEYYGITSDEHEPENGWIAHTQANPFGWTAPGWDFYWGWSTAAVAWLMQNIWEYYEFTWDREMLRNEIYPIMRESARFYSNWLIYDEMQGRYVSSPTYSPEHGPVSVGNTYEQSLIEEFFIEFIAASEILNEDEELRETVRKLAVALEPYHIGRRGQLKEWFEEDSPDFDSSHIQEHHRHISHLMGLYPGTAITRSVPNLMNAAIVTLNERGDESTGWARAYKLNLWARTGDGNRAYALLHGLIASCTYPNLFDFHPPFQLDGNFGGSAGIAEMLLQSHTGVIEPLAAVPDKWESGEYSGLCARGGFGLSVKWSECRAKKITVLSKKGAVCRIKTELKKVSCAGKAVDAEYNNGILSFDTEENGVYDIER